MVYKTEKYTFNGSMALADEVVHIAIKNSLRVSTRTVSGFFKKEHFLEIFGPVARFDRFEREMLLAQNRIK